MSTETSKGEHALTISRTFSAPRDLVWKAFTDSSLLKRWHCPPNFEVFDAEVDPTVGGTWRIGMRSPEGKEFSMLGAFTKVEAPSELGYTIAIKSADEGESALPPTTVTVKLDEEDGKTSMEFVHSGFASEEDMSGPKQGWGGAFDNLGNCLEQESAD